MRLPRPPAAPWTLARVCRLVGLVLVAWAGLNVLGVAVGWGNPLDVLWALMLLVVAVPFLGVAALASRGLVAGPPLVFGPHVEGADLGPVQHTVTVPGELRRASGELLNVQVLVRQYAHARTVHTADLDGHTVTVEPNDSLHFHLRIDRKGRLVP